MTTWTTPHTWSVNEPLTATLLNAEIKNKLNTIASVAGQELIRTQAADPFRTWHLALGRREDTPAKVMFLGHSFAEGQGASAVARRHITRLQGLLRSRFPCMITTNPAGGAGFIPPYYAATTLANPYSATSGSMTNVTTLGPGGRTIFIPNAGYREFTVFGTSIDVMLVKGTGAGTATTVKIDGVDQTAINGNNATTVDGFITHYTFGSRGSHTVRVTATTGAAYLAGIYVYDQDESAGIHVIDASHTGWKASDHNAVASSGGVASLWNLQPALVLIELGINEWTTSVSSATFKTNLQTLIATVKAAVTIQPSIGLIVDYQDLGSYAETWEAFRQVYYDVQAADSSNIALLDMTLRLPTAVPGGSTYNQTDGHPTNPGHDFYANAIANWISPS